MKKSYLGKILALLMLATSVVVIAQDQKATDILKQVSKTYKSFKTIKAGFTARIGNKDQGYITQRGMVYIKGKKFRLNMSDQIIYCDGRTLWTYFKDENEVQVKKFDPNEQEINPAEIFTIYEKGFDYRFSGESIVNGKAIQKIEMTPQDKSKPYFKVKLSIEKASHKIKNMTVLKKNGHNASYAVTSFAGNINIKDAFFKFEESQHPGVNVVKLD
jgi:outer membrane lipoprotein-sorting protein